MRCASLQGFLICLISAAAAAVSVAIPYWSRMPGYLKLTTVGLWQTCITIGEMRICQQHDLTSGLGWWTALCGLEVAGLAITAIALVASILTFCTQKKSTTLLVAGITSLLGGACVAAGVVLYSVKLKDGLEYAHASYYLNIIGAAGLLLSGVVFLCARCSTSSHYHRTVNGDYHLPVLH